MKKMGRVFFLFLFLLGLIASWPAFADNNGETTPRTFFLISAAGPEQTGSGPLAPSARRYRQITINESVLIPGAVARGDRIAVTPFLNESYVAIIDRASVDVNNTLSLRGYLEGAEDGYLLLSSSLGQVLASIRVPDGNREYQIIYDPALETHFIRDLAPQIRDELPDSPSPIPFGPGPRTGDGTPAPKDAMTTVEVMVVYTPAAKTWANSSGGGINNVINQAIQKGQLALDNSATAMTIQLVHAAEIAYTESGDSGTDLDRLTYTSDGFMDSVHQWRDTYGADLVDLLADVEDTGGIGWLLDTTAGAPAYGFSLSRVKQAAWTYTVIHEMGHNMGCHHRKDQVVQPGPGLYSYSAGWRWVGNDSGKYCSVMSYEEDGYNRVPHFSNPSITYQGVATGDAVDGDNAHGLRNIKQVISEYRQTKAKKEDFLGTWDGQGVFYRNSDTGAWVKMSSPATLIACGDLYGDGINDLIGVWPGSSGVWIKNSSDGSWIKISYLSAKHIGAGDMNGDGKVDLVGTWDGYGVQYRSSASGAWLTLADPATLITAGDLDGDDTDDLIGIWPGYSGVWVKYSQTGSWAKLASTARDIASGDMNGDGRDDFVGTWDGQGVFYRNSSSGGWVKIASPATQVTCSDLDADGKDDLIGVWSSGAWVKYSKTGTWAKLSSAAKDITAGKMRSGTGGSAVAEMLELPSPVGGNAEGPESLSSYEDLSSFGPGGGNYLAQREGNLFPQERTLEILKIPGPGEPGFKCVEEKNLTPVETKDKK